MLLAAVLASVVTLAGCAKNIQNQEAVKQGIVEYLNGRASTMGLNMGAMETNVTSVSFEKDVARASVAFVVKGAPGGGGMNMSYVLDRKGDKWVVRGREESPGNAHGAGGLPGASPQGMPPGHPAVGKQ